MNERAGFLPVDPADRLEHVDMVRGFALFGVLLVNMFNFGAWSIVWNDPADSFVASVTRFFFETKSWRLFSMLFGFGFALQLMRAEEKQRSFLPTFCLRLLILFGFGAANALLYDGDILMYYAQLGAVLILFRNVGTRTLVVLIIGLLLVFPLQRAYVTTVDGPSAPREALEVRALQAEQRAAERQIIHPYVVGSLKEVVAYNAASIPPVVFADLRGPESVFGFLAMFLLGLHAGRSGVLHDVEGNVRRLRRVFLWGSVIGIGGMSIERTLALGWDYDLFGGHRIALWPQLLGDVAFNFGATALALAYGAGVILLARHGSGRRLVEPLTAMGRMALTIYLLQTLMFSTLFYGYGFGQVDRLGPAATAAWACVLFAVQMVFANWWVRRYRFGPAEWLWRSLTYRSLQPIRRQRAN